MGRVSKGSYYYNTAPYISVTVHPITLEPFFIRPPPSQQKWFYVVSKIIVGILFILFTLKALFHYVRIFKWANYPT